MAELIVSVSMPNYNHASFLPKRISSILKALPKNSELIICDDGSTDGSTEIITGFAEKDSRVVFIKKEKNEGVNSALSAIVKVARGKYMAFLSADDYIFPDFFSQLLSFAEKKPDFAIYTSNNALCYQAIPQNVSDITTELLLPETKNSIFFYPHQLVRVFSYTPFWIPVHAAIFKREYINKVGGFLPELEHHSDWFLAYAVAFLGGVAYLPKTLSIWRRDEKGYTCRGTSEEKRYKQIQMNFFSILQRNEMKYLRTFFRNSGVLRGAIRSQFFSLVFRPIYWDYIWFWFVKGALKRIKRFSVNQLNE